MGLPLIVVAGALQGRATYRPIAEGLAGYFTVISYDRRGRGDSTDTQPYAVEREIEDLAALIDVVGGSAAVYGHSSGSALALAAAAERAGDQRTRAARAALREWVGSKRSPPNALRPPTSPTSCSVAPEPRPCATSWRRWVCPIEYVETLAVDPTMQAHAPTLLYDYAVLDTHVRSGRSLTEQARRVQGTDAHPGRRILVRLHRCRRQADPRRSC